MPYLKDESVKLMVEISQIRGTEFNYTPLDIGTEHKEGYGNTRITWDYIKDKIEFKNRRIIDIGACCGFIANKLLTEGEAREVWAVEINPKNCDVMRKIHDFNIGDDRLHICCCNWMDFVPPRIGDKWIIMVLNVVHHFKEKTENLNFKEGGKDYREEALAKIFGLPFSYVVFETDGADIELIEKFMGEKSYTITTSKARPNRKVLIIHGD